MQTRYHKGDKIGGRYLVHQALAGGMGEVYLCLDLKENHPLALKTFQARYLVSTKIREYFEREVSTWVALEKHPNIVRCFGMDTLDHQPFMFLEWVAAEESYGTDLRDRLLRLGRLDVRQALELAIDVCRGLAHAEQMRPGIVHCDLKPENVLVAQGGLAKVTDFGLARVVQEAGLAPARGEAPPRGRRQVSAAGGTPPYMAPEQWRGEAVGAWTDVYAVGCLLFELLTGRLPFDAPTLEGLGRQHLSAPVPTLALSDVLAGPVGVVLDRCLAKAAGDRYANAAALLDALVRLYQQRWQQPPRAQSPPGNFTAGDYNNRGLTYRALRRYEEALADFNQALHIDSSDANAYSNRGTTHHAMRRYNDALADFNKSLRLNPNLAEACSNRGATYLALRRYNEALADCTQALRIDPTFAQAYSNRGATFHSLKRYDEALADYDQALRIDPNYARVYFNRGNTYHALRRYDEELADYTRALSTDPNLAEVYLNRGNTYADLHRYAEALTDLNQALCIDNNYVKAYCNRGTIYASLRRYEEALADFNQALHIDPCDAKAYSDRGMTHHALRRYKDALADFNQALRFDPDSADAYAKRGATSQILWRYDEALADFQQALRIDPKYATAWLYLGEMHGNRGDAREALPFFEKAAQLGNSTGADRAARARQLLGGAVATQPERIRHAFGAFQQAEGKEEMRLAVARFPGLVSSDYLASIEQLMTQQAPPDLKPAIEQRLAWLRQIASER